MTDPAIAVDDVVVEFGGVTVLDGVSTTVPSGTFVGLVGPNGAGKTTLLRTITGALDPTAGSVAVTGERLADRSSRAASRLVATVPQSTASTFAFDVRRIVAMGRTPHVDRLGSPTPADRRAVATAMERTDVTDFADRPVTEVSGGERQRVFLARALAQDTPVLLLDEPTSDLDVNHQVRTLELVAALVEEGRTVVAAIHDLDLAARYCDELRLLADGRIRAAGPPESVLTDATVEAAFDTRATVVDHPVTGTASVTAFAGVDAGDAAGRVHVVGGGGAATPLLHRLDAAGFDLSVGPVGAADRDAETARALDADPVTVPPYASVDDATRATVAERVRRADATVVAPVAVADGNLPALRVAGETTSLVVVDGGPFEARNHAGAAGRRVDATLRERGHVVAAADLVDAVRTAVAADGDGVRSQYGSVDSDGPRP
ncbi:ATP-binding cassette domain-containing protein [Haloplanus rallus]|uniref:Cobalamin import ATP-binding protein BtuD n=1 Tax=Haloplanus rallus TaxID=1816183 RepID=A0A6B9F2K2_9EURY|nr:MULTISPECIES: ATP-binding cassette domain-containing protein [Haloplanus]QGX94458.1 ATP-binding cassette domain-containing protein [Haloplanus rallus]